MSIYNGDKYMGLSEYTLYGGIPLVVLRDNASGKAAALQNLFSEIYIRDICKRNKIRNVGELEDLLNILSSANGSLTNPEKLCNTFKTVKKSKITPKIIKKYLDYFEDSFLIKSAQRYDIKGKAYIETSKKYYFSALGLRNARINFRQFEQTHAMENIIYNELCIVWMWALSKPPKRHRTANKFARSSWRWILYATLAPPDTISNRLIRCLTKQNALRKLDFSEKLMTPSRRSSLPRTLFPHTMTSMVF